MSDSSSSGGGGGNSDGAYVDLAATLGVVAMLVVGLCVVVSFHRIWSRFIKIRKQNAVKNRRNVGKDTFRESNGYSWDYIMAFPVLAHDEAITYEQALHSAQAVLGKLNTGGMETRLFYSVDTRKCFVKIRCPMLTLQKFADLFNYTLELDEIALKKACEEGRKGLWDGLKIPENTDLSNMPPYKYIHAPYNYDTEKEVTDEYLYPLYKKWAPTWVQNDLVDPNPEDSSTPRKSYNNPLFTTGERTLLEAKDRGSIDSESWGNGNNGKNGKNGKNGNNNNQKYELSDHFSDEGEGKGEGRERTNLFSGGQRLKLIHEIICYHGPGGCHLDPVKMKEDGCITNYAALHDMVDLTSLEEKWLVVIQWPWNQPIDDIKDYFGEKTALYFAWLGHYTTWLIAPAVFGFIVWVTVAVYNNNPNAASVPYFAAFVAVWATLFLETWKRKQNALAMQWGMEGFEEEEVVRPQYMGEKAKSPVTGKEVITGDERLQYKMVVRSSFILFLCILFSLGVIASCLAIKDALTFDSWAGPTVGAVFGALLLAVQIQIFNNIFSGIAIKLNDTENYRTDTQYEDALISKVFTFQFFNSFAALIYIAYLQPFIPGIDPCAGGCMHQLRLTLGTIFITRLILGNAEELGIPIFKEWFETRKQNRVIRQQQQQQQQEQQGKKKDSPIIDERQSSTPGVEMSTVAASDIVIDGIGGGGGGGGGEGRSLLDDPRRAVSEVEKGSLQAEYDGLQGPLEDYAEMMLQFGYSVMFVAAFPLAPLMALVNNYVEIRVDAWKFCQLTQRPIPKSAEDIGTWESILEVMTVAGIVCNSGIVAFTTTDALNEEWIVRTWIFAGMSTGIFLLKLVIQIIIPDEPTDVKVQLERQVYIVGKVVHNIADEDEEALGGALLYTTPNYLISSTDDDPL